jgi:hypothetical protein
MESKTNPDVGKLITYGQMALEQGWYDKAREYFEQAIALDTSNPGAVKGLSRVNEILSRRASFESMKPEAPPAKPAGKGHPIAEWVREKRKAYAEWTERRRKERADRAAERERIAAERQRRTEELEEERRWERKRRAAEREAEEYREWYETGVATWEVGHRADMLAEEIAGEMLVYELLDDDDLFDDLL